MLPPFLGKVGFEIISKLDSYFLMTVTHIKPSSSNDVNRNQMIQSYESWKVLSTENFLNYIVSIDGINKDFKFRKASFIPNFKKKACNVGSQNQVLILSAGTHLP